MSHAVSKELDTVIRQVIDGDISGFEIGVRDITGWNQYAEVMAVRPGSSTFHVRSLPDQDAGREFFGSADTAIVREHLHQVIAVVEADLTDTSLAYLYSTVPPEARKATIIPIRTTQI